MRPLLKPMSAKAARLAKSTTSLAGSGLIRPVERHGKFTVSATHKRLFHHAAALQDYRKDVLLGASSRDFEAVALLHEFATDAPLRGLLGDDDALDAYQSARLELAGSPAWDPFMASSEHPWDALGFADRNKLLGKTTPYVTYSREAIATAIQRGGRAAFYLGQVDMTRHFTDALRIEKDHAQPYETYVSTVTYAQQQHADAPQILDGQTAGIGDPSSRQSPGDTSVKTHALFTSLELADELELRPNPQMEFISSSGAMLAPAEVRRLYTAAKEATRSPESREFFAREGRLAPSAQAAVNALQQYISR